MAGVISRGALQTAIEKGIQAAPTAPPGAPDLLRAVGRTATSVTIRSFENCPLTQAGVVDHHTDIPEPWAWHFATAFDGCFDVPGQRKRSVRIAD